MAVDVIRLPKDKELLARVIDNHAQREERRLRYRRMVWLLAWYYLNGARRFDIFDPVSGQIKPFYLDEEGRMEFQAQDLLVEINRVAGVIMSMDLRPWIRSTGTSLEVQRNKARGMVILDSMVSEDQLEGVKRDFAYCLTCYGSVGIS